MLFEKKDLVFVSKNYVEREGKKDLVFVTVADPVTFENETFLLNRDSSSSFVNGDRVDVKLVVENRFSSLFLVKV